MAHEITEDPAEMPATILFPGADEPELKIHEVFDVDGKLHQLTVHIWPENRCEASLVSLTSGRRCRRLSDDQVAALAARAPSSASRQ